MAEAERKDRRAGNPVLWTVFNPDEILGMQITTRTPNRILTRRIPTEFDLIATALCEGKDARKMDRFKEESRAVDPKDVWSDLETAMRPKDYYLKPEERADKFSKRIESVMDQWRNRHQRQRQRDAEREARERAWNL